MEILEAYVADIESNEIVLSSFMEAKCEAIVNYVVSVIVDTKEIKKTDIEELLTQIFRGYCYLNN